jgi:hypothetical protein
MTSNWQGAGWANPFDPGAPPESPGWPPQPPPAEHTSTLATLSVVFAFVLAPVGAVLGHLALRDIRRSGGRGRNRAVVGLTLSYTVTVVAVVALVIWATGASRGATPHPSTAASAKPTSAAAAAPSSSAPPEPSVTDAGLATLVLTAEEVADALKAPGMFVNKTWTQPHGPLPGDTFDPPECTAAVFNGLTDAYRDSGYHAIYGLDLGQHTSSFPIGASEFVATFQNADAARNFAAGAVDHMRSCAGKTLTYAHAGTSGGYTVGNPVQSGGVTTVRSTLDTVLENGHPTDVKRLNTSAMRAVAAKANVVVDVTVIGRNLGDDATTLVSRILGRIPS